MTDNCFISDRGASELSKISTLQSLMVSGFLTDDGVSELSNIPSLRLLVVASSKVDSAFTQDIPETYIGKFEGNVDEQGVVLVRDLEVGADGLSRIKGEQEIARIRQLEGQAPPSVTVTEFGSGATFSLKDYKGKVVLIDFWGTWCGPCMRQMPKLKALYEKYQSAGLEIVSIHTSNGSENLPDYLAKKSLPWIHLVDREDSTVKTFFVPHYPSLYLLDRSGKVRVALAHPQGIEETVKKLLSEGQ
jgi:thiol-disulfide isomerase/thioredoxin